MEQVAHDGVRFADGAACGCHLTDAAGWRRAMETLGERLRRARERAGLSQQRLAALADTSLSHISRIETGKIENPGRVLERLAPHLGVSVAWLRGYVDEPGTFGLAEKYYGAAGPAPLRATEIGGRVPATERTHLLRRERGQLHTEEAEEVELPARPVHTVSDVAHALADAHPEDWRGRSRVTRYGDLGSPGTIALRVRGADLMPDLKAGDTLLCRSGFSWRAGEPVIVKDGDRLLVGTLRHLADGDEWHLDLLMRAGAHGPIDPAHVIGYAAGILHLFGNGPNN
jgi:transcriptional regulator with XRE-family HTH domain